MLFPCINMQRGMAGAGSLLAAGGADRCGAPEIPPLTAGFFGIAALHRPCT